MNEYVEKDSFGFGEELNSEEVNFEYNNISGLGESNYQNEDLFGLESNDSFEQISQNNDVISTEQQELNVPATEEINATFSNNEEQSVTLPNNEIENSNTEFDFSNEQEVDAIESSTVKEMVNNEDTQDNIFNNSFDSGVTNEEQNSFNMSFNNENFENAEQDVLSTESDTVNNVFEPTVLQPFMEEEVNSIIENDNFEEAITEELNSEPVNVEFEIQNNVSNQVNSNIDTAFLEEPTEAFGNSIEDNYELQVVEPTKKMPEQPTVTSDNISDTPIEELNKLTEFKEEKFNPTDIQALFNRVGVNVKEASDIFMKNTEMKEKIDARFEELKKLQAQVEQAKKSQYDEINAYKEEVFGKLTEKKEEIENRINKLKDFQANLEKEKEEFEKYRKQETEQIEKVQKEVQEAYDSRREELNHIEDVLRKQKDALDEERSQLSLDRIQYESDKNELANNLLKFNEIVDSFTNGMDKLGNQE